MKKKSTSQSAFVNMRVLIGLFVVLAGVFLALLGFGAFSNALARAEGTKPALNTAQGQRLKAAVHIIGDNFWAQTNGPRGGDVIASATNASGHVFVGTQGGGVFRSTDNGETWTGVNNGLTATNVRALAINSASHIFAGTFGGAFRSTDNGDSWTPVNNGLEFPFVISLAINSSGDIFAGTFEGGGVYRSTDNGDNWTLVDNGLTNTYVRRRGVSFDRQRGQLDRT
jgi:ligand-binding sensor domain-containing protein